MKIVRLVVCRFGTTGILLAANQRLAFGRALFGAGNGLKNAFKEKDSFPFAEIFCFSENYFIEIVLLKIVLQ